MPNQPVHPFERGQALPILALAFLALAAFAALALDGGNLWTEQRRAQAAADNAVMAAAYQQMNGVGDTNALSAAAFANAAQNGYIPGAHTTLAFHLPPVSGPYAGNSHYMQVVITQTVPTALAHLIYGQDPLPLTVMAVAHGSPTGPIMLNYALAAMKPDCTGSSNTIYIQARGGGQNGGTFLTGGGAFVNSSCPDALDASGNHDGIITDGPPIDVVGGVKTPSSVCTPEGVIDPKSTCNWYPAPTTGVPTVPQDPLAGTPAATPPPCGPARTLPNSGPLDLQPGSYTSLDSGNRDMTLEPGIYCLSGGKFTTGNGNATGNGVLLYLQDTACPSPACVNFSGNGSIDLRAPTTSTTGCLGNADPSQSICAYLGILIYKPKGANTCSQNDDEIDFTGNSSMNVVGLVYAPESLVRYGGKGNLVMTGQTIAGCVKFNGNGRIDIVYNPTNTYSPPPSVRLDQ
jgi:hypothetical protein